ncbi:hypothetical protein M2459_003483 [Parabacteroides sp. PF5-5]|uniref:T9SS type A sorting domain-containing protein n=1 Tax=unclassified Parabacteroides TaxID=2649774 RepID=UPI0024765095|nr:MULTISPECIES: T9SS type A sorting domain-containing protein [unclassified Parabacteroides]MDH6306890.1 hypothetical protein [Parabacteroides sp. PH5-39]MDH6317722.1 hypothetical protein [Parabacteroides sp. PF5-13]MDH6321594.1 hypothetical protein [Parabacteroides sp. PH5-13]MDH6325277.1 hypothetical protein [Parabacteroides sp. PH5-8]MDH6328907.1 hypothetical protein [Parabacteroides sp. PH5-41]
MNKYRVILLGLCLLSVSFLHAQVLYNMGHVYVGGSSTNASLYISGALQVGGDSKIDHVGKTILTGDFINNVTSGNVFQTRNGAFRFQGAQKQTIRGSANKAVNYIKFPENIEIDNRAITDKAVTIDADMGANIKNVVYYNGTIVVDSKTAANNETKIAHLWLEDGATTIKNSSSQANIQVNLDLGNVTSQGRLAGFTPPFKTLHADYFFFNFLSVPSEVDLFNGYNADLWITNPLRELKAGTGYILGQGLVPYSSSYYANTLHADWKSPNPEADFNQVIKDKFKFGRHAAPSSFAAILASKAIDGFSGEELINASVPVSLSNGYNYLGNPFLVPLDLSDLLTDNRSDWGITSTNIRKNYYVLSSGSKGSSTDNGSTFTFTTSYLVGQAEGSTTTLYGRGNLIAPMQMFVLKNDGVATNMIIPRGKRTHGVTQFLRSMENEPVDELLIETKDLQTGGYDRICIVFRSNASLAATDQYDAEKIFNRTGGVNQIYTRSADSKLLTTSVISPEEKDIIMYLDPPSQSQEIELNAHRLNTLYSVGQVVLEDIKTGKKTDLTQTASYTFASHPSDRADRFVLHFRSIPTSIEEIKSNHMYASYHTGFISLYGLNEKDLGNTVTVYDMKGQQLYQTRITEIAPCQMNKRLETGVYLIKVNGRNEAIKFSVYK